METYGTAAKFPRHSLKTNAQRINTIIRLLIVDNGPPINVSQFFLFD